MKKDAKQALHSTWRLLRPWILPIPVVYAVALPTYFTLFPQKTDYTYSSGWRFVLLAVWLVAAVLVAGQARIHERNVDRVANRSVNDLHARFYAARNAAFLALFRGQASLPTTGLYVAILRVDGPGAIWVSDTDKTKHRLYNHDMSEWIVANAMDGTATEALLDDMPEGLDSELREYFSTKFKCAAAVPVYDTANELVAVLLCLSTQRKSFDSALFDSLTGAADTVGIVLERTARKS